MYYVRRRHGDGDGYAPVDPFKPSVALGVNNILGGSRDRTIDDVHVGPPVPVAVHQPFYSSHYRSPSPIDRVGSQYYSHFATPSPFIDSTRYPNLHPQPQPQPRQHGTPYWDDTSGVPSRGESTGPPRHSQRVRVDTIPTVINAPAPSYPTTTEERPASPPIPIIPQPPGNAPIFGQTDMAGYPLGPPVIPPYVPESPALHGHYPSGFEIPYMAQPPPPTNVHQPSLRLTEMTWIAISLSFFLDVIPRQVYLHLLLRFPSLYFSRVTRIFRDANMGMNEIKQMALEAANSSEAMSRELLYQGVLPHVSSTAPSSFINLRNSWESFIDSLMREWKTLNIITVLLLSAILTILQIDSAAANPISRYSALMSLVCAFMSLLYGCIYIIRFGSMRKTHKAAEWANESEKSSTSIFWNVWVMLAMPAVWLGWSMIFFITCIMAFVWQTGTADVAGAPTQTASDILVPRIVISAVLGLGFLYLILIGITFRNYSDPMEQAWQERIRGWLNEKAAAAHSQRHAHLHATDSSQQRSSRHYDRHQPYWSQTPQPSGYPLFGSFAGARPPFAPVIPQMYQQPYPPFGAVPRSRSPSPRSRSRRSWFQRHTREEGPTRTKDQSAATGDDDSVKTRSAKNMAQAVSAIDGGDEHSPPHEMNSSALPSNWIPEQPESSRIPLPPPISIRPGINTLDSDGEDRQSISDREHEPVRGSKESVSASITEEPPVPIVLTQPTVTFAQIEEIEQSEEKEGLEDSDGMLEIMRMKSDGVVMPGAPLLPQNLLDREDFMRLWRDVFEAITTAWKRIKKPQIQQNLSWPASQTTFCDFLQTLEEWNQSLSQYEVSLVFVEHDRVLEASKPNEFSLYLGSTDEKSLVIHSEVGGGSLHQYWIVDHSKGLARPAKVVVMRSQEK